MISESTTPTERHTLHLAVKETLVALICDVAGELGARTDDDGAFLLEDLRWAVQQPVSLASVLQDVADRLQIPAPVVVRQVVGS